MANVIHAADLQHSATIIAQDRERHQPCDHPLITKLPQWLTLWLCSAKGCGRCLLISRPEQTLPSYFSKALFRAYCKAEVRWKTRMVYCLRGAEPGFHFLRSLASTVKSNGVPSPLSYGVPRSCLLQRRFRLTCRVPDTSNAGQNY